MQASKKVKDVRLDDNVKYGAENTQLQQLGKTVYQTQTSLSVAQSAAKKMSIEVPNSENGALGVMFAGSHSLGAVSGEKASVKARIFKDRVASEYGLSAVSRDPMTKRTFLASLENELKLESEEEQKAAQSAVSTAFEESDWTCAAPKLLMDSIERKSSGPYFMSEVWFGPDKAPWRKEQPMASCVQHCANFLSLLISKLDRFSNQLDPSRERPETEADRVIEKDRLRLVQAQEHARFQKLQQQQADEAKDQHIATESGKIQAMLASIYEKNDEEIERKLGSGTYFEEAVLAKRIIEQSESVHQQILGLSDKKRASLTSYETFDYEVLSLGKNQGFNLQSKDSEKSKQKLRQYFTEKMQGVIENAIKEDESGDDITKVVLEKVIFKLPK
ncbi:hypothetical protein A7985_02880 [Pseudoalteromonas luteoviolacea]|uniref:Uncharacterized protein n=1 Tax=Pseudoalteromonas luteoviolacea TaxID=43657 RepID=A0A1C0TUB7_9GAMM|nr:hypothetical protein [Pseudoalteromonas luteoviolacea]OCQ22919.1 hypothetical protein A7985_02880 [Pseudoalteromonas luteoviolacea]